MNPIPYKILYYKVCTLSNKQGIHLYYTLPPPTDYPFNLSAFCMHILHIYIHVALLVCIYVCIQLCDKCVYWYIIDKHEYRDVVKDVQLHQPTEYTNQLVLMLNNLIIIYGMGANRWWNKYHIYYSTIYAMCGPGPRLPKILLLMCNWISI